MIIELEHDDGSKNTYQTVITSFVSAVLNQRVDKQLSCSCLVAVS